jgi:hypothetical protein
MDLMISSGNKTIKSEWSSPLIRYRATPQYLLIPPLYQILLKSGEIQRRVLPLEHRQLALELLHRK